MSFKKNIINKYLKNYEIYYIISHDSFIYIKILLYYSIFVLIVFVLYYYLSKLFGGNVPQYVRWFFGIIGIYIYFRFMMGFLDIYLDGIVLTQKGLVIFRWDGVLKYSTESIERDSLESVSVKQNGIFDIIFNKGDIRIKRIDQTYIFNEVYAPSRQIGEIQKIRDRITGENNQSEEKPVDKFDMLVDVLGDVLIDYTNKNKH